MRGSWLATGGCVTWLRFDSAPTCRPFRVVTPGKFAMLVSLKVLDIRTAGRAGWRSEEHTRMCFASRNVTAAPHLQAH